MDDNTCPKCKSDEAYGVMGKTYMCLICGYDELKEKKVKENTN